MRFTDKLRNLNACSAAVTWAETQRGLSTAWKNCERGDWMLWLLGKKAGPIDSRSRKNLALCATEVAELALPHAGKNRKVCLRVYRTIRAYHNGTATLDEVKAARHAAADAAYAADAADAAYAVYAAAYTAYAAAYAAYAAYAAAAAAAYAAAYAAADAAYAAYATAAAAAAAYTAAYAAADAKTILKQSADICREVLTEEIFNAYKLLR